MIDRFANGVATSVKSINLFAKSYQKASAIKSVMKKYIDELASFNGATHAKHTVDAADISKRVLEVAVPAQGASAMQLATLHEMMQYAASKGVVIVFIPM